MEPAGKREPPVPGGEPAAAAGRAGRPAGPDAAGEDDRLGEDAGAGGGRAEPQAGPEAELDRALLAEYAATGSSEVLARIVRRHERPVFRACLYILGRQHDAEDAAQATFLVLVRRARSLSPRTILAGWLLQTARFVSLRARRRRHQQQPEREIEDRRAMLPELNALSRENGALIEQALGELAAPYRNTILLRCLYGRSEAEVAREMGCSRSAVSLRLLRGREKLRRRLERLGLICGAAVLAVLLDRLGAQAGEELPPGVAERLEAAVLGRGPVTAEAGELAREALRAQRLAGLAWTAVLVPAAAGCLLLALLAVPDWGPNPEGGELPPAPGPATAAVLPAGGAGPAPSAAAFSPAVRGLPSPDDSGAPVPPAPRTGSSLVLNPREQAAAPAGLVRKLAYAGGGQLVTGGEDGLLNVWQAAPLRHLSRRECGAGLQVLGFSASGRRAAAAGPAGMVRVSASADGREVAELAGDGPIVCALAFLPDEEGLLLGDAGGRIRLWRFPGGEPAAVLGTHEGGVGALACAPDGRRALSAGADGQVVCWALPGGAALWRKRHGEKGLAAAISPDGRWGASGADDNSLRLWELAGGRLVWNQYCGMGGVRELAFAPDSRRLAVVDLRPERLEAGVDLLEIQRGECLATLLVLARFSPAPQAVSLAFSPDNLSLSAAVSGPGPADGAPRIVVYSWDAPPAAGRPRE